MFLFKKFVTPLFYSLTWTLIVLAAGTFLLIFTRRQKAGRILMAIGTFLIVILTCSPLSDLSLRYLESRYPPFSIDAYVASGPTAKWIVVLGAGAALSTWW